MKKHCKRMKNAIQYKWIVDEEGYLFSKMEFD